MFEEMAFVAYHFNWSHATLLNMPHIERQRWCEEISLINERLNDMAGDDDSSGMTLGGGLDLPGL